MRKKITKALAVCMAFGVLAGSSTFTAMLQNTAIQKAAAKEITKVAESEKESQKEESEKDFLVQTQNKTERKKVIAVLKESIDNVSDTASILKSENILMADLSAKQINEVDECLKASWEYEGHKSLIHTTDELKSDEIEVIRYTSYYVDDSEVMKTYDVLHARGNSNYVAAAKCLYRASRVWKSKVTKKTVCALADTYVSSKSKGELEEKEQLSAAIEKAVTYNFKAKKENKKNTKATVRQGRLQLLGLAIHVAGDAYAHKVKCLNTDKGRKRITEIYNKYKSKIKPHLENGESSIKEMRKAIKKGLITSQMKRYFKDNQTAGAVCNKYYTDSTTYMEKRHSVGAKTATNKLLSYFGNGKAFKEYVFCPYESDDSYSYKLRYLVPFLKDAGFDLSNSDYTEKEWEKLSCN